MFFSNKNAVSWLIVCLGNIGDRYDGTRHNIGFEVADELARRGNFSIKKIKHKALTHTAIIQGQHALIMKPTTFMNLSGEAVIEAAGFYKIPHDHILVIYDDISLPVGKLRLRRNGSAGGHNGMKSIIHHLSSEDFPRIKIGVGAKPHPDYDLADWVLGKFQEEEKTQMQSAVQRASDAVECILLDGFDKAMSQFN